ncbi:MAG: excisionase family DNA-binding protein [Rhodocyclaceae bacterium]
MSEANTKQYCSTKQAAERLGVSLGTVQQMLESGVLEGWKTAGGHRRILVSSVDRFISQASTGNRHPSDHISVIVTASEDALRELYERTMDSWGLPISVQFFSNGFDMLIELGHNPPDLLITDLCMPGLDGFEMIRRIRENCTENTVDIVVLTTLPNEEIETRGGLPKDVTLYRKPVPFHELRGYIQALSVRKSRLAHN